MNAPDESVEPRLAIQRLFATSSLAHLSLPDGGIGRAGDNLYRLTYIEDRPRKLLVELDDQLLLVFTEAAVTSADHKEVRLRFKQLTFDWEEYGSLTPHASTYSSGQVVFFGPTVVKRGQPRSTESSYARYSLVQWRPVEKSFAILLDGDAASERDATTGGRWRHGRRSRSRRKVGGCYGIGDEP